MTRGEGRRTRGAATNTLRFVYDGGVRTVDDRPAYHAEKEAFLAALAAMLERIIGPPTENVTSRDQHTERRDPRERRRRERFGRSYLLLLELVDRRRHNRGRLT